MRKITILLLIILAFISLPCFHVNADMGPKRSIIIEIIGVDAPYVIDLLYEDTLPPIESRDQYIYDTEIMDGVTLPDLLKDIDDDGFISAFIYYGRPLMLREIDDHTFGYPYSPPTTIKIILIFEDEHYVVSNQIDPKLFSSELIWDLSDSNIDTTGSHVGTIKEVFPVGYMSIELILRIVGTIGIEILVLYFFFYRDKHSYLLAIKVNIVTQVILTFFMFMMRYFWMPFFGEIFILIVGEIIIIILEMGIYAKFLKEHSKKRAVGYAFVANVASLITGLLIIAAVVSIFSFLY